MATPDEVDVWVGLDVGKEEHFAEVLDDFLTAEAIVQVRTGDELKQAIEKLLGDPKLRLDYGKRARRVVEENSGAIQRTVDLLDATLFADCSSPGCWRE